MENDRLKKDYLEATNYTFLDFLLNNNHYRLFNKLYQTILTEYSINQGKFTPITTHTNWSGRVEEYGSG